VDAQTRSALKKEDPLVHSTQAGLDWIAENRATALRIAIAAVVLIAVIVAAAVIYEQRATAAANAFGQASAVYNTPLTDPSQPMPPGVKTYANAADRAKDAYPLFEQVAQKYGSTTAGHNAQYFAGLAAADMDNTSQAEADFRKVADFHNANHAALGKLALANLLAQHGQNNEALKLYEDLIKNPTTTVPKSTGQLQLAALYEAENKPANANEIYALIKAKDTRSAAGQIAAQKLAGQH